MVTAGDTATKSQTVDIGPVFIIQHQTRAIVAAEHQLVIAHLSAQGQAHLVGGRSHKEVAIEGAHHFMPRPRVARRHTHRRLAGHRFLPAQAGFHHDVGIGQVHLDHAHLERQCRDVIFGSRHAGTRQMRENQRVHLIGFVADGPHVTGPARNGHQRQRYR